MRRHRDNGVTLLEVLVATAIGSLLVLATASMLGAAGDIHAGTENELEVARDARATLNILENDLAGRLPLPIYHARDASGATTSLGFWTARPLAARLPADSHSDLCYVHYYTAKSGDSGKRDSTGLFRAMLTGNAAIAHFRTGSPAPPVPEPGSDDVAATNLLTFRCAFRARDENGIWQTTEDPPLPGQPAELLVVLRLLTRAGEVARLEAPASGGESSPPGFDWDSDENNDAEARTFRARFFLPAPPI